MRVNTISRREFLSRVAIGAGAGMLGCRDYGVLGPPLPGDSGLEHVIVVTMENRSFDHLLGWLPGADGRQAGLMYADRLGTPHETHHLTDVQGLTDFRGCGFSDPNHSFAGGRVEYNGGACDGWLRADGNDLYAIGYYEADDLAFLGQAAREWTVLDRYFAPFLGPTVPNRLISHAGQTDRLAGNSSICMLPTIWDRLADRGLSGRNYVGEFFFATIFGDRYPSLIQPIDAFFADAAAGALPHVAFVDPNYTNDDHPHADMRSGEAFLASIYLAVTTSPAWRSTALIVTFDEWGGFFDHVAPPPAPLPAVERDAGNDGLRGFRVPTILISPFARRRYTSSTIYDHASILRLIEWRWGLSPLTVRDAQANNLADALDFTRPNANAPVIDVPIGPFARCS
jgi:phospholipase C